LKFLGTIGVLELAAELGQIDLEWAFEAMKQTDLWVTPRFLDQRIAVFRARRKGNSSQSPPASQD
jgi:hypothetical protein